MAGSTARYKPFGDYRTTPTNDDTDMDFTGHKGNAYIKLIYMNARFYSPGVGKFASADTIVPNPSNPQAYNRYAYVYNNPLLLTDPTGHDPAHCADQYESAGDPACNHTPDWWNNDDVKTVKVEGYGIIDFEHVQRGYRTAEYMLGDTPISVGVPGLIDAGGGILRMVSRYGKENEFAFVVEYLISGDLTTEEIEGVIWAIYMDFELKYEQFQQDSGDSFQPLIRTRLRKWENVPWPAQFFVAPIESNGTNWSVHDQYIIRP